MNDLTHIHTPNRPALRLNPLALLVLALPGLALADDDKSKENSDANPSKANSDLIQSRTLSDKIYKSDGVIDLLKNIKGSDLTSYFNQTGGLLMLGADLNKDGSGEGDGKSVGLAIQQAQLSITTTKGDFTFRDFFTNTSSELRQAGSSTTKEYATLFGRGGSSEGNDSGKLNVSNFDDVMWFSKIAFEGEITSAKLSISFLPTQTKKATASESFFNYSEGFENFALFNAADAALVEEAKTGMKDVPSGVKYETNDDVTVAIKESASNGGTAPVSTPPAAPAPPLAALASMGLLMLWKKRNQLKPGNA